jgi:hypothetical protein
LAIRAERSASIRSNANSSSTDGLPDAAFADAMRPESVLLCAIPIGTPALGKVAHAIIVDQRILLQCSAETTINMGPNLSLPSTTFHNPTLRKDLKSQPK